MEKKVIMFCVSVTPSPKEQPYTIVLVFDKNGKYLPSPVSRCLFPDRQLFCLHTLGLAAIFYLIQVFEDWDTEKLKTAMPPPVKSIQKIPILVMYVYSEVEKKSS